MITNNLLINGITTAEMTIAVSSTILLLTKPNSARNISIAFVKAIVDIDEAITVLVVDEFAIFFFNSLLDVPNILRKAQVSIFFIYISLSANNYNSGNLLRRGYTETCMQRSDTPLFC